MKINQKLKKITLSLVLKYENKFEKESKLLDKAIIKLFRKFPKNIDLEVILLKTVVINSLYNVNIFRPLEMARHILSLKNIDTALTKGDPEIVDRIARASFTNQYLYSFATKYCSFHNPQKYPIYDQYVGKILKAYNQKDKFDEFSQQDLRNYPRFLKILDKFKEAYCLDYLNYKKLDQFLWIYGEELFKTK